VLYTTCSVVYLSADSTSLPISEDIDSNGMATYDHACHKLTTPLCRTDEKGSPYRPHGLRFTAVTLPILSLLIVGVDPVLAQQPLQSSVCSAENLPGMIEGFFQITTSLGIIGLAIVWQADSLIDMFTLDPDQKKEFKQHKLSAMKSAVILVVLGPLYTP